jgi:hypothetical protein
LIVTEETKTMVIKNISFLLNSFLSCSTYENIIFCWVMHESSISDSILSSAKFCQQHFQENLYIYMLCRILMWLIRFPLLRRRCRGKIYLYFNDFW